MLKNVVRNITVNGNSVNDAGDVVARFTASLTDGEDAYFTYNIVNAEAYSRIVSQVDIDFNEFKTAAIRTVQNV